MSDIYCPICGRYHASLTVCPNQNLQAVYTQKGTTTIDLDEMRAEIARLRAREAKLSEALVQITKRDDWTGGECRHFARAALQEEGKA